MNRFSWWKLGNNLSVREESDLFFLSNRNHSIPMVREDLKNLKAVIEEILSASNE